MQEAGGMSMAGKHNTVAVLAEAPRPGCEGIRIHSGDLTSFDSASAPWCLRDLNSFCFAPFPTRLGEAMNADVVCHALEFCKQDAAQSRCHLYPLPQVSGFCSECHFPMGFRPFGNVIKGDPASFAQWFVNCKLWSQCWNLHYEGNHAAFIFVSWVTFT